MLEFTIIRMIILAFAIACCSGKKDQVFISRVIKRLLVLVPVAASPAALMVARLKERLSRCYSKSGK
jgi:hypothetical protein